MPIQLTPQDQWQKRMQGRPGFWEWAKSGPSSLLNSLAQPMPNTPPQAPPGGGDPLRNLLGGIYTGARDNYNSHPIYGTPGNPAHMDEFHPTKDNSPEAMAARVAQMKAGQAPTSAPPPAPPTGTTGVLRSDQNIDPRYGNPLIDSLYDTAMGKDKTTPPKEEAPKGEAPKPAYMQPDEIIQSGVTPSATDLKKNSDAMVEDMKSNATPEEQGALDKFAGQFDFTTVGMALLASNDGSGNLTSNLGKALMMGRQAKMEQDTLKKEDARAERKEDREDKKVSIEEQNVESQITTRQETLDQAYEKNKEQIRQFGIETGMKQETNESDIEYKRRLGEAATANAHSAYLKAKADAQGFDVAVANPTTVALAQQGFAQTDIKTGEFEGMDEATVQSLVGGLIATDMEANPGMYQTPEQRAAMSKKAVESFMRDYKNNGFLLGTNYVRKDK